MGPSIRLPPRMRVLKSLQGLTSAWVSLAPNPCFLVSPRDRWGRFRLGVQLCFAQTDASGHSQTQIRVISLRELVA